MIDINMGCPVRKVIKTGAGAALMGDPARAAAVARAVVSVAAGYSTPVTVKIRSGLRPGDCLALQVAQRMEAAGIAAIGIHPRAASEYYSGKADHSVTADVSSAVDIPVMASGDIHDLESALHVLGTTSACAVMVARGAAGNPWLLRGLLIGRQVPRPPLAEVVDDLRALLALAAQEQGEERAARWIRKLLTWYLRPTRVPPTLIAPIRTLETAAEVDAGLAELLSLYEQS
jgi:nifR3 family TIM-barrel protein